MEPNAKSCTSIPVTIPFYGESLQADLQRPSNARGTVIFIHGSGSSRLSARNREVAAILNSAGFNTFLVDLLTEEESELDARTREFRFDIALLAGRSVVVARWVLQQPGLKDLPIGLFGASTGAAAALISAGEMPNISAVVSRGGRPDLAGDSLHQVQAPTLLIVGGDDHQVLALNRQALAHLRCVKQLHVVPCATHLFEEPGALRQVADVAAKWFSTYLTSPQKAAEIEPGRQRMIV